MEENLETLTRKYVANQDEFDILHAELMIRFYRLGE
jgi:hypothetical protein